MCDHNWVHKDTEHEHYWTYVTKRKRNGKLKSLCNLSIRSEMKYMHRHLIFEVIEHWYCSICRIHETKIHTIRTFDEVLEQGYAIFNWRTGEYLMPERSTKEVQG